MVRAYVNNILITLTSIEFDNVTTTVIHVHAKTYFCDFI